MSEHTLSGTVTEPQFQNPKEVNAIIQELAAAASKSSKSKKAVYSCRKTTFKLADRDMEVHSWKFLDQDYKKRELPTYARGLFTTKNKSTGNHEIVIRGYDKFFNTGEVRQTKWDSIRENTKGPYELTMKENGCIIFISGLEDDSLLVCSKHSTGARGDVQFSHAMVGEKWIDKHLASVGKTRVEMSRHLRSLNATAVAELCDDSFEEHILPYTEDQAGLYLHGINFNVPKFATCSQGEVQKFAETYGMRKTDYFEMNDVDSLKKFLEEAAETGTWDGKDVEGFVIRCKARHGPNDPKWHDWFFKYKFEEPYLMYRQWREVTKMMLSGKEPKYRKHKAVTNEYLAFAKSYFQKNPSLIKEYQANHGIIKLRDAFVEKRGMKGSDLVKIENEDEELGGDVKLVLVPIATIGCGKTTLAIALSRLFQWGHVQNDNIPPKNRPPRFASALVEGLRTHQAVIADRNNSEKRERKQLFEDIGDAASNFVALHYVHDRPDVNPLDYKDRIRKVTRRRVLDRGDNHQTIRAESQTEEYTVKIMEGFLHRFQPLDHDEQPDRSFHTVIDLDVEADSRTNLETVILHLREAFPSVIKEMPTKEQMDAAIEFALKEYQAGKMGQRGKQQQKQPEQHAAKGPAQQPKKVKTKPIEYFSVQVPYQIIFDTLKSAFETLPTEQRSFYNHLKDSNRLQQAFHVTLIHCASLRDSNEKQKTNNEEIWNTYSYATSAVEEPVKVKVKLDKVVWDGRVMAIAVTLEGGLAGGNGLPCANEVPHITVGTKSPEIKPKESNNLLVAWKAGRNGQGEEIHIADLGGVLVYGKLEAVHSR